MPGILTHSPADIIRYILVAESIGVLPTSSGAWPINASSEPDSPDNVITVYDEKGESEGSTMNDGEIQEKPGVKVRVRGKNHPTAYAKSQAIAIALDGIYQYPVTIDGTTYSVHQVLRDDNPLTPKKELNSSRNVFEFGCIVTLRQTS